MIVVKLIGGLGNQMFQYAFAKHLAIKHGVELKLDISELGNKSIDSKYSARDLELSHFNIVQNIANTAEIRSFQKSKVFKALDLFYLNMPFRFNNLFIKEPSFTFYKQALNAPSNCYLDGYWQSENYFIEIRNQLLNDFTFGSDLSSETKQLAEQIKNQDAVSIHVRRGDYISISQNKSIYEVCDSSYYLTAMDRIVSLNRNAVFYVFSDEPNWFKEYVNTSYKINYVTHNVGSDSYQDLYLMSLCKHNIIANSSFSWWGAWLNKNVSKVVIAPKRWFKNNFKETKDLIPKTWIQL